MLNDCDLCGHAIGMIAGYIPVCHKTIGYAGDVTPVKQQNVCLGMSIGYKFGLKLARKYTACKTRRRRQSVDDTIIPLGYHGCEAALTTSLQDQRVSKGNRLAKYDLPA